MFKPVCRREGRFSHLSADTQETVAGLRAEPPDFYEEGFAATREKRVEADESIEDLMHHVSLMHARLARALRNFYRTYQWRAA